MNRKKPTKGIRHDVQQTELISGKYTTLNLFLSKISVLVLLGILLSKCNTSQKEEAFPDFTEDQIKKMIMQDPQQAAKWLHMESMKDSIPEQTMEIPKGDTALYEWNKKQYVFYRDQNNQEAMQQVIDVYTSLLDKSLFFTGRIYYNRMLGYIQLEQFSEALQDLHRFNMLNDEAIVNSPSVASYLYFKLGQNDSACISYERAKQVYEVQSLPYFEWFDQVDSFCKEDLR